MSHGRFDILAELDREVFEMLPDRFLRVIAPQDFEHDPGAPLAHAVGVGNTQGIQEDIAKTRIGEMRVGDLDSHHSGVAMRFMRNPGQLAHL